MVTAELRLAGILIADPDAAARAEIRDVLLAQGFDRIGEVDDASELVSRVLGFRADLVVLDPVWRGADGVQILADLRGALPESMYLPVLAVASDDAPGIGTRILRAGATDYLGKPFDAEELVLRITNLLHTRFLHLRLADQTRWLEQRVVERTQALEEAHLEVCDRLARAAEFRDDATGQHTRRVGRLSVELAQAVGMDEATTKLLAQAAPLHDVGKIAIPDAILLKPGQLTPSEFAVVRTHTTAGAELLSGGQSRLMQMAEQVARSHHERWDGQGYPHGLAGEAIPVAARVVAVADFFDAVSHPRPYRAPWPRSRAVDEIRRGAGTRFDPALVEAFLELPAAAGA